jgi:hypothetical protein
MTGQPQIVLAELWQRESAKGSTYYSGYLGGNRLPLFDAGMQDHATRPGEQVHVWRLVLQARNDAPRSERPTRNAERGAQTWKRSRHAVQGTRAAGEALFCEAGRDFAGAGESEPPQSSPRSREAVRDLGGRG